MDSWWHNNILNFATFNTEYPAPSNVWLDGIQPGYLAFSWNPVSLHCETLQYKILSTNCGIICPSSTNHHTITCTPTGGRSTVQDGGCIFTFAVQTVVCGGTLGNTSDSVSVVLKGIVTESINLLILAILIIASLSCSHAYSVVSPWNYMFINTQPLYLYPCVAICICHKITNQQLNMYEVHCICT